MQEFIKLLSRYKIRKKFFEVIIDNVSNNKILKDELNKVLNRRHFVNSESAASAALIGLRSPREKHEC